MPASSIDEPGEMEKPIFPAPWILLNVIVGFEVLPFIME
ncbi:hypothetical protein ASZ90_003593 [hydrocarbon metagenome]|uniref:Uncharacterized protein n=1 Tax=hydrocarbon metagenome TaxID=938273 RepID=A0A0W8G074_9ZZZZ